MRFFFVFFFIYIHSIHTQNYASVDSIVRKYPKLVTATQLAERITNDFSTDQNRVRAVFSWLALNIRYDLQEYFNPNRKRIYYRYRNEAEKQQKIQAIKDRIVHKTLTSRKAVCEGYAQTFNNICTLLGIENEIVKGYVRNSSQSIGHVPNAPNHAWNLVKIDGKLIFIDATWAAGYQIGKKWRRHFNDYYFDISKEKLFFTHFPEQRVLQLRTGNLSIQEFYKQPIYGHTFLRSNLKLISPTTGIISPNKKKVSKIKLKNLTPNQSILYMFSTSKHAKQPAIKIANDISELEIAFPINAKYLYVFIDTELALEFVVN